MTQHELSLTPDAFEPFNSPPNPARPQTIEDMKAAPIFVMKVSEGRIVVDCLMSLLLGVLLPLCASVPVSYVACVSRQYVHSPQPGASFHLTCQI